jgi:hypothetical protein
VFSGVIVGAVVDRAEDESSGDTTTFDVHTLLEAFLIFFSPPFCVCEKQNLFSWDFFPQFSLSGF